MTIRFAPSICCAYEVDRCFGLLTETLAQTGTRNSQAARLVVGDLQADNGAPRLMMPTSRKGRNWKAGKRPVPISPALAQRLVAAAGKRDPAELLLIRADGRPWQDHQRLYREAAKRAGVEGSMYALRHSSIIRALLANVPIRIVAALHDTSTTMIERVYSSHVADFSDAVARPALLELG